MDETVYWVIEKSGENIGQQGFFPVLAEAQAQRQRLEEMFRWSEFYIVAGPSDHEPEFLTV